MSKWNWAEKRQKKAFIALADGTIFRGYSVGAPTDALGEVVFNTGMAGYQEILTDPSYSGQFVTMTYPEIGNYGINEADMESRQFFANGLIIHEENEASNWRSQETLCGALSQRGIPCIAGIDTRALTILLREKGTQRAFICVTGGVPEAAAVARAREWCGLDGQDYAAKVSCTQSYPWDPDGKRSTSWGMTKHPLPPADLNIVAFDFGIKFNILRRMRLEGMDVTVVPAKTTADEVMKLKPDGVFLSNGPADPAAVTYAIESARSLMGRVPIMGICLGHQILGLAVGGTTYRLKFGHHGCNHPVRDEQTMKVEITSQNHNYAVDPKSLDMGKVEVTHINLNDMTVEGLRHRKEPMFCVQYHPEAGPGPNDPLYLFKRFRDLIKHA